MKSVPHGLNDGVSRSVSGSRGQTHTHKARRGERGRRAHRYTHTGSTEASRGPLHRRLLALLIHYVPLGRRQREGSIEVLAIWRHVEMYINANP